MRLIAMQNAFALIIVAAAASYLVWRTWNLAKRRKQSACGACGSCPSGDNAQAKAMPLVTVESLKGKQVTNSPSNANSDAQ
jgi:hypothetical protein